MVNNMNFKSLVSVVMVLSAISLSGCVTPSGKSYTSAANTIRVGDSESTVINIMGNPDANEFAGRDKVLKFCSTDRLGFTGDPMIYVWIKDGRVKNVINDRNKRIGECYSFFKSVNWDSTISSGYLYLNNLQPTSRRSSSTSAVADVLRNSMERDNQIYNSLINNMGAQQRALQPQRLQTNCMWVGNMLSCN
jgi:hypothetical protein